MATYKNNDDFCDALKEAVTRMKQNVAEGIVFTNPGTDLAFGKSDLNMNIDKKMAGEEEWIWVEGYKGTNHDMTCRGYQFALGGQTDMPEGAPIEVCESGFHFCLNLRDVFRYYDIGQDNRFFKVRGLVRKSDFDNYGKCSTIFSDSRKLAAKSIIFLSECGLDEIFSGRCPDWTDEDKRLALKHSVSYVKNQRAVTELMGYGYSEPFANWLVNHSKYEIAKAVGSQPDLSMDMKCLAIFK